MAETHSFKHKIESALLHRMAHADVFEIGTPRFLFVLFGGSGVDKREYDQRATTLIPHLGPSLQKLKEADTGVALIHICAPYDLPLSQFSIAPRHADLWNQHVTTELLEPWPNLPYFVSGFSGGVSLALNGLDRAVRCFGGATFGADRLNPEFSCSNHWPEKLQIYVAPNDRVSNLPENQRSVATLVSRGQAQKVLIGAGGHRLPDYAATDSLARAVLLAQRLSPTWCP